MAKENIFFLIIIKKTKTVTNLHRIKIDSLNLSQTLFFIESAIFT